MQDLRLVGISENGEHVLLTDDAGGRYSLALNDDLKRVVRRDKNQTLGATAQTSPQEPLRPRDVQALIRAGVPLEEIAERAGWSVDKVLRYEGPIRAERDYIGELAQSVILESREDSVTLRDRAAKRLADRGVEAERVVWDSWKSDEDHWSVVVRFPAGGRLREATWHFDPGSRTLRAIDDEARWLGGDENARAPKSVTDDAPARPAPAHTRDEPVFDVEAEGWEEESNTPAREGSEHREELTTAMRQRHANRRTKNTTRTTDPANITGIAAPSKTAPTTDGGVEKLDLTGDAPPFGSHPRPGEFLTVIEGQDSSAPNNAPRPPAAPAQESPVVSNVSEPETNASETEEKVPASAPQQSTRDRRRPQRRSHAQVRQPSSQSASSQVSEEVSGPNEADETKETPISAPDAPAVNRDIRTDEAGQDRPDGGQTSEAADADGVDDPKDPVESASDGEDNDTSEAAVPTRPTQARKGGRPSVPSWDDIMFGGRSKR